MTRLNNKAFTILETLITLAVIAVSSVILATMMVEIKKNQKQIESKLKVTNVESAVQNLLSKIEDCSCQFRGKVFNSTLRTSQVNLSEIKLSCGAGSPVFVTTSTRAPSNQEVVSSMIAKEFVSTGNSNEYTTSFYITPVRAASDLKFQSVPIRLRVFTDPDSPLTAKRILGCGPAPLSIPTGLRAVAGDGQCTLTWNESSGARPISYTIKRSTVSGSASSGTTVCGNTGSLACLSTGLNNGTRYYYTVRSSNPYEASGWSAEVPCTPAVAPVAPVIAATLASRACTISWAPPAGTPPITYTVYMSTSSSVTTSSSVVCTTSSTSCTKSGLTDGVTYYFRARASNVAGNSPLSGTVSCRPETIITSSVSTSGDCIYIGCPAGTYITGCSLSFSGGDHRGCVSITYNGSSAFLKEGNECGRGWLGGSLSCSSVPPNRYMDSITCPINKPVKIYPGTGDRRGCPR